MFCLVQAFSPNPTEATPTSLGNLLALSDLGGTRMPIEALIGDISLGVEVAGVAIIVIGAIIATLQFLGDLRSPGGAPDAYRAYRNGVGRSILLGLELLVAADIIRTVAVSPSFASVGILASIVLIRTFLSMTLELEITGRWPWQRDVPRAGPTDSG
jgi:uncharacterized membrane protein